MSELSEYELKRARLFLTHRRPSSPRYPSRRPVDHNWSARPPTLAGLETIRANQEVLRALGLDEAASSLRGPKPVKARSKDPKVPKTNVAAPRRRSRRSGDVFDDELEEAEFESYRDPNDARSYGFDPTTSGVVPTHSLSTRLPLTHYAPPPANPDVARSIPVTAGEPDDAERADCVVPSDPRGLRGRVVDGGADGGAARACPQGQRPVARAIRRVHCEVWRAQ